MLLAADELLALSRRERAAYDEGRRDYHGDLPLVNTPTIRQVINTSRLLVQLNRRQVSARRGVIISGASGTGKTTALTQLGRTHERHIRKRHPGDRHRLPVIYVTVCYTMSRPTHAMLRTSSLCVPLEPGTEGSGVDAVDSRSLGPLVASYPTLRASFPT
ncbi:hypothetical protein AB0K21_08335 [Streptosporangium sp. NPDC049248]|uniref:hypothetical protein n=1 Tax=Streptosporangium sp. NPDC049248 TaxID=3155651 RepID=UPI0034439420